MPRRLFLLLTICTYIFFSFSCHNKDVTQPIITDSIGKINKWVYDSMQRYYYWSSSITGSPDYNLSTDAFFHALLNNQDRFSVISNQADVGAAKNSFELYGFHYAIIEHPALHSLAGVITYVAASTPASRAGLKRGICFRKVNGKTISKADISAVTQLLQSGDALAVTPAEPADSGWTEQEPVSVESAYIAENPVVQSRYFLVNGKKTGYIFYNSFGEKYDVTLVNAFTKMKGQGVTECIIDLRYNPGGSVSTCAKMAGMLAPLTGSSVFGMFQGNGAEGRQVYTMERILQTSSSSAGKTIAALEAARLSLTRVFILTGRSTVSAAELLINNLKPYVTVVQIGDTTLGKDEASFEIRDFRVPKQVQWVIRPIVYKLLNASGNGGYHTGLVPSYYVNELAALPLGDPGTADDLLTGKALEIIYGTRAVPAYALRRKQQPVSPVYNSATAAGRSMPAMVLPRVH